MTSSCGSLDELDTVESVCGEAGPVSSRRRLRLREGDLPQPVSVDGGACHRRSRACGRVGSLARLSSP
jgi:hypothetical protein